MRDSRLTRITALLDDARCLIVDVVDEKPFDSASLRDFNSLDAARQFINHAILYTQAADSDHPKEELK